MLTTPLGDIEIYVDDNKVEYAEKNIGVSESTLLKWIRKLNPEYCNEDKDYYRMVIDYLALIKVEQHHPKDDATPIQRITLRKVLCTAYVCNVYETKVPKILLERYIIH